MATCRQQERYLLELLTGCFRARLDRRPAPSLIPGIMTLGAT
ncbi:hypothetical protein V5E97_37180 [Singulisphaera sp. Ch08]|uniref:Uncharacterized protein n=1 Tax=Singulisphaera sp. Ch08 TaxID=3120278 RepID=A0AAU7CEF5_9BACT